MTRCSTTWASTSHDSFHFCTSTEVPDDHWKEETWPTNIYVDHSSRRELLITRNGVTALRRGGRRDRDSPTEEVEHVAARYFVRCVMHPAKKLVRLSLARGNISCHATGAAWPKKKKKKHKRRKKARIDVWTRRSRRTSHEESLYGVWVFEEMLPTVEEGLLLLVWCMSVCMGIESKRGEEWESTCEEEDKWDPILWVFKSNRKIKLNHIKLLQNWFKLFHQ